MKLSAALELKRMTYQQLIEEFDRRREDNYDVAENFQGFTEVSLDNIQCTLREILIKLSNGDRE